MIHCYGPYKESSAEDDCLGIRIEDLPAGTVYEKPVQSELPDSCYNFIEYFAYVGNNFTNGGYVSTLIEDWAEGAFNWPDCHGFERNPVTHNMRLLFFPCTVPSVSVVLAIYCDMARDARDSD
jgi:hypothetical protein